VLAVESGDFQQLGSVSHRSVRSESVEFQNIQRSIVYSAVLSRSCAGESVETFQMDIQRSIVAMEGRALVKVKTFHSYGVVLAGSCTEMKVFHEDKYQQLRGVFHGPLAEESGNHVRDIHVSKSK
jgi:hypothetical protein